MQTNKHNIIIAVMGLAIVVLLIALFTKTSEAPSSLEIDEEANQEATTTDAVAEDQPIENSDSWNPPSTPPPATAPAVTAPTVSAPPTTNTIQSQDNLAEEVTVPYSATVSYNGERFWPEEALIREGGRVHFVNNGDTDMWIASDNHPRHDRYLLKDNAQCGTSDFDQCTAVGPGETWTFVFNRSGTWGYHNHVDAKDTGTVVVIDNDEL